MAKVDGTISLREAQAPLQAGEARFHATAGLILRGTLRRGASQCGVDWFEQKGWLDSYFVFRGPAEQVRRLFAAMKKLEEEEGESDG